MPNIGGHAEPDEFRRFRELFRHAVCERRRREFFRLADIGPDIAAQLLGRIRFYPNLAERLAVVRFPRNHYAAAAAIEAQSVPGTLQRALENAPGGKLRSAMRTF